MRDMCGVLVTAAPRSVGALVREGNLSTLRSFYSVPSTWCDCKDSIAVVSMNLMLVGTERRAHLSVLNISRNGLSPVFKNPILRPSFCLALNLL